MKSKLSPAGIVLTFSITLLAIIFAIFGVLVWQAYYEVTSQAEAKAQAGADLVAQETSWVVGSGVLLLKQVETSLSGDPANFGAEDRASIDDALKSLPASIKLSIYDATGRPVAVDSGADLPPTIGASDYFRALAGGQDWQVSPQLRGAQTGEAIFVIAKRLAARGAFTGVAVLTLDGSLVATFWTPPDAGRNATVSVMRTDGWIVARYPALKQPLNLNGQAAYKQLLSENGGTYASPASPADGIARIVGYRHVPGLDLIAIAAVSQDAVINALWGSAITVLLLMGPIAVALLVGSFLTARLLNQSDHSRQLLETALAQNQVLFREVHHRVKNNLQSVGALVQLQPIPDEIKVGIRHRISAMSAVHEHIYRSDNFASVEVKDYLHTLIENLRQSHGQDIAVIEELESGLTVHPDTAMPLGLILNEVVSNAFKHAFPNGRNGQISVRVERAEDGRGVLSVRDNGVGFDPSHRAKGMGRRLIAGLAGQLGGEATTVSGDGSLFTVSFPLSGEGD